MPAAHIEEAFDVWWPKLDETLKALPDDLGPARLVRPERDLLEEILALVRNQSRLNRSPLFTVDTKKARLRVELRDILSRIDPKAVVKGLSERESRYTFMVETADGQNRPIMIPKDAPKEVLESIIIAQLSRHAEESDENRSGGT